MRGRGETNPVEYTIDEVANIANMTVRNVRAYASRGLVPAPRLEGRTGYYSQEHVDRLLLVRELLDRGYTLAAVEKFLNERPEMRAVHALDLFDILGSALGSDVDDPEEAKIATLTAMSGLAASDELVERLITLGLAERVDAETLLLLQPTVIRAGTQAIALGLDPESVFQLLPIVSEHMRLVGNAFVEQVRRQIWLPFVEAGMPDEDWAPLLRAIEVLTPVAAQAVLAVFQKELNDGIAEAMGAELDALGEDYDTSSDAASNSTT